MSNSLMRLPAVNPYHFDFDNHHVRSFIGDDNEPRFIGADVCEALEIANNREALARLDDDEKGVASIDTPGGIQNMVVINESGLFSLVLSSRKPEAKRFKRWITHEVIPAIRKNGSYSLQKSTPAEMILQMAQQLVDQERAVAELDQRMLAVETRQTSMEQGAQYFTILAYASMNGIRLDTSAAQVYGSKAAKLSRDQGAHIGKASDPRYGYVGTYHVSILDQVFKAGEQ